MKKIIQIIIGFIIIGIWVAIIKTTFFTDDNQELYEKGISYYNDKEYVAAKQYFNWVDKRKIPEAVIPLGYSYFYTKDYENAIQNLQGAFEKKLGKPQSLSEVANVLGISYMHINDLKNARIYLEKAKEMGNQNSVYNLKILDSLEQKLQNRTIKEN